MYGTFGKPTKMTSWRDVGHGALTLCKKKSGLELRHHTTCNKKVRILSRTPEEEKEEEENIPTL